MYLHMSLMGGKNNNKKTGDLSFTQSITSALSALGNLKLAHVEIEYLDSLHG